MQRRKEEVYSLQGCYDIVKICECRKNTYPIQTMWCAVVLSQYRHLMPSTQHLPIHSLGRKIEVCTLKRWYHIFDIPKCQKSTYPTNAPYKQMKICSLKWCYHMIAICKRQNSIYPINVQLDRPKVCSLQLWYHLIDTCKGQNKTCPINAVIVSLMYVVCIGVITLSTFTRVKTTPIISRPRQADQSMLAVLVLSPYRHV